MDMDSYEVGRRMRVARGERNQKDIAALAGVDDSTYGYWESGKSAIRATDLVRVCRVLDVSVNHILGLIDEDVPSDLDVNLARLRRACIKLNTFYPDTTPNMVDLLTQHVDGLIRAAKSMERRMRGEAPTPQPSGVASTTSYSSSGPPPFKGPQQTAPPLSFGIPLRGLPPPAEISGGHRPPPPTDDEIIVTPVPRQRGRPRKFPVPKPKKSQ
jgi:transcriptional regulator with XRE-family HTH domain